MLRGVFLIICLLSGINAKEYNLSLNELISLALKNNISNKISKYNLKVAQAQYNQALSSTYPSIDALVYVNRDDNDSVFQQRASMVLPASISKALALANTLSLPAANQAAAQAAINAAPTSSFENQSINVQTDPILKGRDTIHGEINLKYPLYTGGKISSKIEQARLNTFLAKESIIKNRHQLIFDVKKYFYGYVFTNELYESIEKIYDNMSLSSELARVFLEEDESLDIKKTDYLNIKLLTKILKSTLKKIELNRELMLNAISNLIGLKWDDKLKIIYSTQKINKINNTLYNMIKKSNVLNSDINKVNLFLKIKEEEVKEAGSNYYPQVALYGSVSHTINSYEYGYLNEDNRNSWKIGIAVKMSLFDGYKTKNTVLMKKIEKKLTKERKLMLKDFIATQLKNQFLKSTIGYDQINILKESIEIASENSDLNLTAFTKNVIKANELIQSQLSEVYVKADYFKQLHDYNIALSSIDKLIGERIYEDY